MLNAREQERKLLEDGRRELDGGDKMVSPGLSNSQSYKITTD
jgi:hypothetical protein